MRTSFRARIAGLCVLLVLASVLAASVAWYLSLQQSREYTRDLALETLEQEARKGMELRAQSTVVVLGSELVNPLYYFDLYTIATILAPVLDQSDVAYALVFDADGRIVHDGRASVPLFGSPMNDELAPDAANLDTIRIVENDELLDIASPLKVGSELLGGVRVGFSKEPMQTRLEAARADLADRFRAVEQQSLRNLIGLTLLILTVGSLIALWLGHRLTNPIRDLVRHITKLESGDYDVNLGSSRSDELGDLIRAFDRMSESVHRNTMEIRHIAYHDTLSGLPNRLKFREVLEQKINTVSASDSKLAILFLDLDDFKRVNDTLGHDAGDALLVAFAERLKRCVNDSKSRGEVADGRGLGLVARLGGDEFTVLLHSASADREAVIIAQDIVDAMHEPLMVEGHELYVTTSIGITVFPDDAQTAHLMVKNADIAMYSAKLAGKNRFQRFDKGMSVHSEHRIGLENDLRRAMLDQDFRVVFQPIVSMATQQVIGAEALVRWTAPDGRDIPPSVFVPVLEDIGLIGALSDFVVTTACREASQWPESCGQALSVTVNISPRQIHNDDLLETLAGIVEQTGFAPQRLAIEITENAMLETEDQVVNLLTRLRGFGFKVWLDDFGTGFSGLSQLRRIQVDGVKIDQSFVSDILLDPDDLALTSAIITMAKALNIRVIAEGVESAGQMEQLLSRGCNLGQGFLFGKPMAQEDFVAWLKSRAMNDPGIQPLAGVTGD